MSASPPTDLWLERSRFQGMILNGVSYGILLVLTIQAIYALFQRPEHRSNDKSRARTRWVLLVYIVVTFMLATLGVAANAEYSQIIWIDKRATPGGPASLIVNELGYWENRMALTSYYIMGWIMNVLLMYRCFVIWNWHVLVIIFMSALLLTNIIMAILTLVASSHGAVFISIGFQLAYLVISIATNIIYTILVAGRLLALRRQIITVLGKEHTKIYVSTAAMVVESSALDAVFGVIYLVSYALRSNVENLFFLWSLHVQAIAQLLIILRIARGSAIAEEVVTCHTATTSASSQIISVSARHQCRRHTSTTNDDDTSSFPMHPPGLCGSVTEEQNLKQKENELDIGTGAGAPQLILPSAA